MIVNYRDDPDLQNLVDWVQKDWVSHAVLYHSRLLFVYQPTCGLKQTNKGIGAMKCYIFWSFFVSVTQFFSQSFINVTLIYF